MSKQQNWMDQSGQIADRTNTIIAGLLDWADKSDVNAIKRRNIEDAITQLTPVNGEDTVNQYVRRVAKYGPFVSTGAALWRIQWERVHAQEESSMGAHNE